MIYRSNLTAPDLQPYFKHVMCRPMPHSNGHSVLSDFADSTDPQLAFFHRCGFMTPDEVAIIHNIAKEFGGDWLEIGSHTAWVSAHIAVAGCKVIAVDPMYRVEGFLNRTFENLSEIGRAGYRFTVDVWPGTSDEFFEKNDRQFSGVVIDGDHMEPHPHRDAVNAAENLTDRGVIIFHDAVGAPVQQGVRWLVSQGFKHKVYWTPHVLAVCWRGDFTPPEHQPDPKVAASVRGHWRI